MKICPKCKSEYEDDSMSFCIKDGTELVSDMGQVSVESSHHSKRGCLKTGIVICVVVFIVCAITIKVICNSATYLRLEPNNITAIKGGGSGKINVDTDGFIWSVNYTPDWVTIDEYDNYFNIVVEPNQTGSVREGAVTVQTGDIVNTLSISQNAFASYIKPSETNIKFEKNGGKKLFTIQSDGCNWKATYDNWLDLNINDDNVTVVCPSNNGYYRSSTITVTEDYAYSYIIVTQEGICNMCYGEGESVCRGCGGTRGMYTLYSFISCYMCGGSGKVNCSYCGGTGYRKLE